jgi:hypothetical protein
MVLNLDKFKLGSVRLGYPENSVDRIMNQNLKQLHGRKLHRKLKTLRAEISFPILLKVLYFN